MDLGVVIARDEGEQARSVVTLPREPGFALAQFVFAEAEAPAATVGDEERIRRNIERRSSRRWFRAVTDALDENRGGSMLEVAHAFDIEAVKERRGKEVLLREGHALFVPAGAEHRFSGYEELSLLVIFERRPARAS